MTVEKKKTETETETDELMSLYESQNSQMILVLGESGRGKSRSLKFFDPQTTIVINVMGKRLPFAGALKSYHEGKNLFTLKSASGIIRKMRDVSRDEKFKHVKNIVIDDGYYIMTEEMFEKALVTGYTKWTILAKNINDILKTGNSLRGDLKCWFLCHEEMNDKGIRTMKTSGKLLEKSITPEGLETMVVYADVEVSGEGKKYFFTTQSDGVTNAKTPEGMFPERIPNDLELMSRRIDEYYEQGIEWWEDSSMVDEFEVKPVVVTRKRGK